MTISEAGNANPNRLDLGGLDQLLGFHVRMAQIAMYRDYAEATAETGLTQKQGAVMQLIGANPGVSQIALAATLGTDRATMMALVNRLQHAGLLARRRSLVDGRRQEIELTAKGVATLARLRAAIDVHEQRFLSRFNPEERAALYAALRRLHQKF